MFWFSLPLVSMLHFHFAQLLINNSQGFGEFNLWPWNHNFNYLTLHINGLPGIAQWLQSSKVLHFSVCIPTWIYETPWLTRPEIKMATVVTIVSMIEKYWRKKASSEHLETVSFPALSVFFLLRHWSIYMSIHISTLPFLYCILDNEGIQVSDVCL